MVSEVVVVRMEPFHKYVISIILSLLLLLLLDIICGQKLPFSRDLGTTQSSVRYYPEVLLTILSLITFSVNLYPLIFLLNWPNVVLSLNF